MSMRKYRNPVSNHFIYNDDIRKSTCKICYFDMAGRHSENLMRHLKRKHPSTYAEVMLERQRRRSAAAAASANANAIRNQTGSTTDTTAGPLSSMFKFVSEPHKLFIKSEKLVFRLNTPEQQQQIQLPMTDTFPSDNDEEHEGLAASEEFESVYLAKTEIRENLLNDSNESQSYEECQPEGSEFAATTSANAAGGDVTANSTTSAYVNHNYNATNEDDAFFLQYLANKFSRYSANTKNTVQFHINRILYKADMGCYENVDASKISETDS